MVNEKFKMLYLYIVYFFIYNIYFFIYFSIYYIFSYVSQQYYRKVTLTMAAHFTMDNPKPAMAPKRPATVCVMQSDARRPIQLKRNATAKKQTHMKCKFRETIKVQYTLVSCIYYILNSSAY